MLFRSAGVVCVVMVSLVLAVDQELESETEIPVNGYVMGVSKTGSLSTRDANSTKGPKSTVGNFASKVPVAEKASNNAGSVETFDNIDFEKALKDVSLFTLKVVIKLTLIALRGFVWEEERFDVAQLWKIAKLHGSQCDYGHQQAMSTLN